MQSTYAEVWKPVVGFEGTHEVSDRGRVRGRRKVLRQHFNHGYPQVTLRSGDTLTSMLVHRLVAEAFIGPRPAGDEICHGDGDKANNTAENLRYDTRAANGQDKRKHGHGWRGEAVNTSVMTTEKVLSARARYARGGITVTALAAEFGMSRPGMSHIINRRHWYWLPEEKP